VFCKQGLTTPQQVFDLAANVSEGNTDPRCTLTVLRYFQVSEILQQSLMVPSVIESVFQGTFHMTEFYLCAHTLYLGIIGV